MKLTKNLHHTMQLTFHSVQAVKFSVNDNPSLLNLFLAQPNCGHAEVNIDHTTTGRECDMNPVTLYLLMVGLLLCSLQHISPTFDYILSFIKIFVLQILDRYIK